MIATKSLRIDYDNVTAVDELSLRVTEGQIYGLVGPNGAGKTSTLKALAGIIEPTYGEIRINGLDLELKQQEALQMVGFMPDFPPVYENLKVWEYLDVFAAAYLIPREERILRAQHWVKEVNLQDKWDSLVSDLSRGMRQRLILAKTLLHEPKVLLLDEPASGLDPVARMELRNVLKKVAREGKTIIISSHILTELSDFCNAIGIMEKGQMVVSGTMDEIRDQIGSKGKLTIRLATTNNSVIEKLRKALNGSDFVQNLTENDPGLFHSNFLGNQEEAAILLSQLVKKKIPIYDFHLEEEDVEDIFFKIGAKEVS